MFHVKSRDLWETILLAGGVKPSSEQLDRLDRYLQWLAEEAIPAGGIGPGEVDRLPDRHIGDSLLFLVPLPAVGPILDVGSGVGLPGIPLAIALPEVEIVCLDRSGRRTDLLKRAVRVLDLKNVTVVEGAVEQVTTTYPAVVSRASIPPDQFRQVLDKLLEPGGIGIVGGSWTSTPEVPGYETREIGSKMLDIPVWILIMTA